MYGESVALIDKGKIVKIDRSDILLKSEDIKIVYEINIREFMINVLEKWR